MTSPVLEFPGIPRNTTVPGNWAETHMAFRIKPLLSIGALASEQVTAHVGQHFLSLALTFPTL